MNDRDRDNLVNAWDAAGLPAPALVPVLDAISEGQCREAGERVLADVVQPAIADVYAGRGDVAEREAQRLRLVQVFAYLRHAGAVADIVGREPERVIVR